MSKIDRINKISRPELGQDIPLGIFRAFRHFSFDYVERVIGKGSIAVFQHGGRELGREVGGTVLTADLEEYLGKVVGWVKDARIGLLRPVALETEKIVLALDECITCAGMEAEGKHICQFETGLVAGVVETFTNTKVRAFESKCNVNGDDTCEVTVDLNPSR